MLFDVKEGDNLMLTRLTPVATLHADIVAGNVTRQWLLAAVSHIVLYYCMWKEAWVNGLQSFHSLKNPLLVWDG